MKFAEGNCTRSNCSFNHVALSAMEIDDLKIKLAAGRKASGAGATGQRGGHTTAKVVNALKTAPAKKTLAEKMKELRTSGLSDEQIIKCATVLLENQ